jgi:hypothetical protein
MTHLLQNLDPLGIVLEQVVVGGENGRDPPLGIEGGAADVKRLHLGVVDRLVRRTVRKLEEALNVGEKDIH